MNELNDYIKNTNGKIYLDILLIELNRENDDFLQDDLIFLLTTLYPYHTVYNNEPEERTGQNDFRKILIKKYNKCIITNTTCMDELEAAHIIPYNICKESGFNIENGLLLKSNIHKTFDKYYWTINPDTHIIEVKQNIDVGEIKQYEGVKVNLDTNNILLYKSLKERYNLYI